MKEGRRALREERSSGDVFDVDGTTGATVCAQLQEAGRRVLDEGAGVCVPPPGVTRDELLECGCDQVKR